MSTQGGDRLTLTNHPLRAIRSLVRDVLHEMSRSFAWLYSKEGRASVPPVDSDAIRPGIPI